MVAKKKTPAPKQGKPDFGRKWGIDGNGRLDWHQHAAHGTDLASPSEGSALQGSLQRHGPQERALQLPARARRALEAGTQIKAVRPTSSDILFVPAVFAFLGLPITGDQVPYIQRVTLSHLKISPNSAEPAVELPSGSLAFLTMISLTTVAIRQGSALVSYAAVLCELARTTGAVDMLPESKRLSSMLSKIADCTFSYDAFGHRFSGQIFRIERTETTAGDVGRDSRIGSIALHPDFYAQLSARSVPLDRRAVAALSATPMALRVYMWLTQRICKQSIPRHTLVWKYLFTGLGAGYSGEHAHKNFKRAFLMSLIDVLTVYPWAVVYLYPYGVVLAPSGPSVSNKAAMASRAVPPDVSSIDS